MTYDAVLKESLTHRREPSTSSLGFLNDKSLEQQQQSTTSSAKSNVDNQTVRTVRHTHHRSLSKTFTGQIKLETDIKSSPNAVQPKIVNKTAHNEPKTVTPVRKTGHQELEMPQLQVFFTHLCYFILNLFGHLREFLRKYGFETRKGAADNSADGFAPLFVSFEAFHTRNCYIRNRDCFNRPICSVPGAEIELVERVSDDYNWTFRNTGRTIKALNMGSYNYLGFAENDGPCSHAAQESIREYSVATSSPRQELGTLKCQVELESLLARFLGVESALTFGMGFGTNALNIPALLSGKKSLILSDELNHASLILGARLTGATVRVFKHNNMLDLEQKLKKAIIEGMPGTGRPWKKILIIVEGVYSMEGTITPLKDIIELKKKYKAYLYLDEAHSIGALGQNGRGIVDHFGCDPRDVDILMGTFSKSFGAAGGYIAGSRSLIDYLKHTSHAGSYASSMSPPVCIQITKVLEILMGLNGNGEGRRRIKQLAENVKYFRDKLIKMGFIVYGNPASPVVPAMLFTPPRVALFNRMMLERNIAVVTVGFPATILPGGRVRFCISAAHTRQMLDKVLEAADVCGHWNNVKISKFNPARTFQQVKEMDRDEDEKHKQSF